MRTESERYLFQNEKIGAHNFDVVIVGAGLSGLYLASEIGNDVTVRVIDTKKKDEYKHAMYLVSRDIASSWGLSQEFESRKARHTLISGYSVYGEDGDEIDAIPRTPAIIEVLQLYRRL
jgi:flavin-dependent dehydrogenase